VLKENEKTFISLRLLIDSEPLLMIDKGKSYLFYDNIVRNNKNTKKCNMNIAFFIHR